MSEKTKAYYKLEGCFKPIDRNYICSLNEVDKEIFIDKHKPFFLEPYNDSLELTFNRYQRTFRFYPKDDNKFYQSNEESLAHKYCIEEISKLKELIIFPKNPIDRISIGNSVKFSYNYSFPEIIIPIEDSYVKPDLLLFIRKPYDLALKWNRVLAVEIVVSHDLNGKKLELMQDAKIPILRIKANKKWGRKKDEQMNLEEKNELRGWIRNSFKKGYSADFL